MNSDNYPAILYRDGVLSPNAADQRTVTSSEAELAAAADGFERWTKKPAHATAAGTSAPEAAAQAAFNKADKRAAQPAGKGKAAA